MTPAASWSLLCLTTLALGASLPGGEDPYREQQAPGIPRTAVLDDQRFGLSVYGSGPTRAAPAEIHKASNLVKKTRDLRLNTSGDGDAEVTTRGGFSDNTDDEDEYAGSVDDGGDRYEEEYYDYADYGYDSRDDHHVAQLHYTRANYEDNGDSGDEDGLYLFGNEILVDQVTNCSEIGGGIQLCFQNYDVESYERDKRDHRGKGDDEVYAFERGRSAAYVEKTGTEGRLSTERLDKDYLFYMMDDDDDDDDDDADDIYLYVKGNETSLLTFLNMTVGSEWELPLATEIEGDSTSRGPGRNDSDASSEAARRGLSDGKADPRLPTVSHDNVPRDEIVVLSDKQVKSLNKRDCHGCAALDAKSEKGGKNTLDPVDPSSVVASNDEVKPDFVEDDISVIARTGQVNDQDIVHEKLSDTLKENEGSVTESQEWKPSPQTGLLINGWAEHNTRVTRTANLSKYETQNLPNQDLNFSTSTHEIGSFEEVYELIMHSSQVSQEEKHYISSLEKLRRLVNKLGGFEAFREKPQVHYIVKRHMSGTEACAVLSRRRRRRAVEEAEEVGRGSRSRRGLSNVGKNLEQGNPRFRQLFNQYKTICDFMSLLVFEK